VGEKNDVLLRYRRYEAYAQPTLMSVGRNVQKFGCFIVRAYREGWAARGRVAAAGWSDTRLTPTVGFRALWRAADVSCATSPSWN